MKKATFSLFALSLLFFLYSCGNGSGVDPHLSEQELEEIRTQTEINLVGRWKLRRRTIGSKINTADCNVDEIEFINDNTYLLTLSAGEDEEGNAISRIYKGVFDLDYTETDTSLEINRLVLMGENYNRTTSVPQTGLNATLTDIVLEGEDIRFNIALEDGVSDFCDTATAIEIAGDKDPVSEPNAPEDSNHIKIQNEWRFINITTTITDEAQSGEGSYSLCNFFAGEYYDRCFDEATESFEEGCPQATTATLLFTAYGTYLFSYYDENENLISTEPGGWKWIVTEVPYTQFKVKTGDDTFEETDVAIDVITLTETTLVLSERTNEIDQNGNEVELTITYNLQLESLSYQDTDCPDFSQQSN